MSKSDPETTLREFREYFARSYEANHKIAARIGVTAKTFADWLTDDRQPMGKALEKLRTFLDAEAKRSAGEGIRPIEGVPLKIVLPPRQLHYARLCPFCRKARGEIHSLSRKRFQGICPKCGAAGPKRESHQEALWARNGRSGLDDHITGCYMNGQKEKRSFLIASLRCTPESSRTA